jgi:hypothetical protein
MRKFKIGDRVRLAKEIFGDQGEKVGDEFTVLDVTTDHSGEQTLWIHEDGTRRIGSCEYTEGAEDGWRSCRFELVREQEKAPRDYVADHARRTLRKAGLSKEEAAAVVRNWDRTGKYKLSQLSRKLPIRLSKVIAVAFTWDGSPEGSGYWRDIWDREFEKEQNAQAQP